MSESIRKISCLVADTEQSTLDCFSMLSEDRVMLTLFSEKDNGDDLQSLVRDTRWDIIVIDPYTVDCTLPELKKWLRHVDYTPFLVMASWADDTRIVDDTLKSGATLYYIKPFSPDFPETLINRLCGQCDS